MMDGERGGEMERLAMVNSLSLEMEGEQCLDHSYKAEIQALQKTLWSSPAAGGGRQWTYQTCTEFGWYQSTDTARQTWGHRLPVKFFEKMCQDIFGRKFSPDLLEKGIKETNTEYGGLQPRVSKVVFVHGSGDPWHRVGRTQDLSRDSPAILIPGTAHCANMYPASEGDPTQLVEARTRVGQLINKWITEATVATP